MLEENKSNANSEEENKAADAAQQENAGADKEFEAAEAEDRASKAAKKAARVQRKGDMKKKFNSKSFRYGSYSTIVIAVVIVIAILVNIGVVVLVDRFPSLKLDLTSDGRYQVSDKLDEILSDLAQDTELIFCASKEEFESSYNSSVGSVIGGDSVYEGTRIVEMMSKAGESHNKLTVSFLDLESNPNLAATYGSDIVSTDVIVRTANRHKVMHISDFYQQSGNNSVTGTQTTDTTTTYVSYFEYELGNAITNVNSTNVPTIAFTSGHGETTPEVLSQLLQDNCFDVTELNMMTTPEIDPEIDTIVISAPTSDFTNDQTALLDEFLSNGEAYGKSVVVMLSPAIDKVDNLNAFLKDWGYEISGIGSYVVESDTEKYISTPLYPVGTYNENSIYADLKDYVTIAYGVVPITQLWSGSHSGVSIENALTTSDTSYAIPSDHSGSLDTYKPDASEYKAYPLVTLSSKGITVNNEEKRSYVSVVTSSEMFNNLLSVDGSGNSHCALTLFQNITGTTGNAYSVYIKGLTFNSTDLTVTSSQAVTIGITLFTIALPLAVVICGLVIWLRRRHL